MINGRHIITRRDHITGAGHIKIFIGMIWGDCTEIIGECKKAEKSESCQLQVLSDASAIRRKL